MYTKIIFIFYILHFLFFLPMEHDIVYENDNYILLLLNYIQVR